MTDPDALRIHLIDQLTADLRAQDAEIVTADGEVVTVEEIADEIALFALRRDHALRFGRIAIAYPSVVAVAYGHDLARAAADSDEQIAVTVAEWERSQGLEPRDWHAIGRHEHDTIDEEFDRKYAQVCDVVFRTRAEWPLDDDSGLLHTSEWARAAATRIFEILDLWNDLEGS